VAASRCLDDLGGVPRGVVDVDGRVESPDDISFNVPGVEYN
jgi:hypothetical protein